MPRAGRIEANVHCTLVREDGSLVCGFLADVSDKGFCVASNDPLELNERVEIRVSGLGRLAGIVRWVEGGRAGGVLEPYSRGAFEDL